MPRGDRTLQVSFAGGEMSPEMYSRWDDSRLRSGAARLRNMVTRPWGAAARRPGFQHVREVKDSTKAVRLMGFEYSDDQTLMLEIGRADIDGLDSGYVRFHTEGQTLLQPAPRDYTAAALVSALNTGTETFTTNPAHGFETDDEAVLVLGGGETATFDLGTDEVINAGHGFQVNEQVVFQSGGTLPTPLVGGLVYYIIATSTDRFQIADEPGGSAINLGGTPAGVHLVACCPLGAQVNTVYRVERVSSTEFRLYTGGILQTFTTIGTADILGSLQLRRNYGAGDVVAAFDIANSEWHPYYCRKRTWGTPASRTIATEALPVFATSSFQPRYWQRQSGLKATVTVNTGTDRVVWSGHGLSEGDPLTITTSGTMPGGINEGQVYYARNVLAGDFQLSENPFSLTVVDITSAGTGTHTGFSNGFFEVAHDYGGDTLFAINNAQSNDILTLAHFDRPVTELRRLAATTWQVLEVIFNGDVSPPENLSATPFLGEGNTILAVATPGGGIASDIQFDEPHTLGEGESVMLTGSGAGTIPDGEYVVSRVFGTNNDSLWLKGVDDGLPARSTSTTPIGGIVRPTGISDESWSNDYVVTAFNVNDEESPASETLTVSNNLLVPGARNDLAWDAVPGARRYRIYKDVQGLFGFIGEVDAPVTSFQDDNIGPDLSITPPILDTSLRQDAVEVAFDPAGGTEITLASHGLALGQPVIFDTPNGNSGAGMPSGIVAGETYYVYAIPTTSTFQVAATPISTAPITFGVPVALVVTEMQTGEFPSAVTYFEQRRIFGGSRLKPQTFWMTAVGTESDLSYSIPTVDSDRISNRLSARKRAAIRHAVPAGHLLMLTASAEYRLTPLDADALTPGSVAARAPTHVGAAQVAPALVNNVAVFAAARGGHVREMGFVDTAGDYVTADVSLRAEHLFENRTIVQMDEHQAPSPIVWVVSSAGTLLSLGYVPEEAIAGWAEHDIGDGGVLDKIESVGVIPEGTEDRVYIVANRNGTKTIERMGCQCIDAREDVFFVDSGITYEGAATTQISIPHLAGQVVVFLADGVEGTATVSAAGILTVPTAATKIHAGLDYSWQLTTLPLAMQVDAALGSLRTKNITQVGVRCRKSGRFQYASVPIEGNVVPADSPAPEGGQLLTELVDVRGEGDWNLEGQLYLRGSGALPMIITGLTLELASGG